VIEFYGSLIQLIKNARVNFVEFVIKALEKFVIKEYIDLKIRIKFSMKLDITI